MKDLAGKVAVVTGGASGIGLAMAKRFAAEGMKLVLADIEAGALEAAAAALSADGAELLAVRTDVSKADEMDALAGATLQRFGAVHVVCLNAGVGSSGEVPVARLDATAPRWQVVDHGWRAAAHDIWPVEA